MDRGPYGIKIYRPLGRIDRREAFGLHRRKPRPVDDDEPDGDSPAVLRGLQLLRGYDDGPEFAAFGKIDEVLARQHEADTSDQTARSRSWWAAKLAEYVKFHEDKQKTFWAPAGDAPSVDKRANSSGSRRRTSSRRTPRRTVCGESFADFSSSTFRRGRAPSGSILSMSNWERTAGAVQGRTRRSRGADQ